MFFRISRRPVAALLIAAIALNACGDSADAPTSQSTTALPSPTQVACHDEPLSSPSANQLSDPWLRARAALPSVAAVLRPGSMPEGWGPPVLLEACTDSIIGDDGPRYTVIYNSSIDPRDAIVFSLGPAFGAWGNFPGPPTARDTATVRGGTASILVTERASSERPGAHLDAGDMERERGDLPGPHKHTGSADPG